jgi:hypothetical protein
MSRRLIRCTNNESLPLLSFKVQRSVSTFKSERSRILRFEGSHKLKKILHFVQGKL